MVETPGFGEGNINVLIQEMNGVLKEDVKTANVLLILVKATTTPTFNEAMTKMLREFTVMFGKTMWNTTMIGVR